MAATTVPWMKRVSPSWDGKMITHPKAVHYGIGALPNPELRTRVVNPNDLDALEAALSPGDVACVITEPTLSQALRGPPGSSFP